MTAMILLSAVTAAVVIANLWLLIRYNSRVQPKPRSCYINGEYMVTSVLRNGVVLYTLHYAGKEIMTSRSKQRVFDRLREMQEINALSS